MSSNTFVAVLILACAVVAFAMGWTYAEEERPPCPTCVPDPCPTVLELTNLHEGLGECQAANASTVWALDAIAAKEDGCARFLKLEDADKWRLVKAGRPVPR